MKGKSSIDEIRARFDADVERFSNLETGQEATVDAPLAMELISRAAVAATSPIRRVLDIGCGAGNNTLKLLDYCPEGFETHLVDLSLPMLERAHQRVASTGRSDAVHVWQGDFREYRPASGSFDVVIAAAVLHHLREDRDWENAFRMVFESLRPGGSFWITDLVSHENSAIHQLMWRRYGDYLESRGGPEYRRRVFDYIELEDSPRPVSWQLDLLRRVGFRHTEILHKNSCFAAFGAIR